ncbi:hypothetical protein RRG08_066178 [Elysia crispata]|uniref:Uncharacterized protein n=1 Tax=Elysia crispata TaxID=231223 RepID=A0AAE1D0S7_9GAST|nr:hypothetical protein RRG08_066178 [Elysia crispata]
MVISAKGSQPRFIMGVRVRNWQHDVCEEALIAQARYSLVSHQSRAESEAGVTSQPWESPILTPRWCAVTETRNWRDIRFLLLHFFKNLFRRDHFTGLKKTGERDQGSYRTCTRKVTVGFLTKLTLHLDLNLLSSVPEASTTRNIFYFR